MFSFFYLPILVLLKSALIVSVINRFKRLISPILAFYISIIYLLGMYRSRGVDIKSYRRNYEQHVSDIFDPGYNLLMTFSRSISLPFELFLLGIGVINIFLIRYCCTRLNVSFGIVIAILALHLFLVRDFTQLRVSLAVNLVLSGYLMKNNARYFFYMLGGSIHFTSLVLIGLFISYEFQKRKKIVIKILPFLCVIVIGFSLSYLSFLDPRVDMYLNWDRKDYGQSVTTYNQVFLILFFLIVAAYRSSYQIDVFVYSFMFGLVVFASFAHASVFSYRLSNICISLYPFLFAMILNNSSNVIYKLGSIVSLIFILSLREGNLPIIKTIVSGFES